ncbi:PAS domain-containing protein [Dongia soli]|uniref:PAS domain-containing protein n=1 Tax=Dongia soli TaxID=600628 RepID=A0ABU5E9N4_9PROT|nr:PAS domain-containing protein [Dongia soli]MDY0882944.1 PAS domain-containing protein [Dongia soli]
MAEDSKLHPKSVLQDGGLKHLRDRWYQWRVGEALPLRSAFDPMEFPRQLSLMMTVECVAQSNPLRPYDALIRYMGTGFVELFEAPWLTNTTLSALGEIYGERWLDVCDQIIAASKPIALAGRPYEIDKDYIDFEILGLPLSKTGETADYLIMALAILPRID